MFFSCLVEKSRAQRNATPSFLLSDLPYLKLECMRAVVLVRQFALTFQPSSLVVVDLKKAFYEDAPQSKMKEVR